MSIRDDWRALTPDEKTGLGMFLGVVFLTFVSVGYIVFAAWFRITQPVPPSLRDKEFIVSNETVQISNPSTNERVMHVALNGTTVDLQPGQEISAPIGEGVQLTLGDKSTAVPSVASEQ